MTWQSISEVEIWNLINKALDRMTVQQQRLWEVIQIMPEKWDLPSWGDEGGGFWVVAIVGRHVIWYNDIEQGFNRSTFPEFGRIEEYRCNQDRLEDQIQTVIDYIRDGYDSAGHAGPPQPIH